MIKTNRLGLADRDHDRIYDITSIRTYMYPILWSGARESLKGPYIALISHNGCMLLFKIFGDISTILSLLRNIIM